MRIVKEAEVRREEIVNEAVRLFAEKGFRSTSVNDILAAVGIAKGTFYYHFKSKEEVLNAAIETYAARLSEKLAAVATDDSLNAVEKFVKVVADASSSEDSLKLCIITAIHQAGNELLHEKSLIVSVLCLSPILTAIVEQGNAEGIFRAEFPQTTVETLLIASQFMFDTRFFASDEATDKRRLREFLAVTEDMLHAPRGTFAPLAARLLEG